MSSACFVIYLNNTNCFSLFPCNKDQDSLKKSQGVGPIRKVLLLKEDHEGLGISITVRSCAFVSLRHSSDRNRVLCGASSVGTKYSAYNSK
jgi:hypothetical protein